MPVATRQPTSRTPVLAIGGLTMLFVVLVSTHRGGSLFWTGFSDVGQALAPMLATGLAWRTARRSRVDAVEVEAAAREARGWWLIGAGTASWAAGQTLWTVYDVVLRQDVPSPGLCDVGFLLCPLLLIAGLVCFVDTPAGRLSHLRGLAEGMMIAAGAFVALWGVLLGPVVERSETSLSSQVIALAYPLLDAMVIAAVVFVATRRRVNRHGALLPMALGVVALAVADGCFWYLTSVRDYDGANPTDAGWVIGFLLIGLASSGDARRDVGDEAFSARRLTLVVPDLTVGLAAAFVAIGWVAGAIDTLDPVLVAALVVLGVIGAVHRVTVVLENHALTTTLEQRVAQRTAALDAKERYFHALVQHSSDVIVVVDDDLRVRYLSDSVMDTYGFLPEQLLGHRLDHLSDELAPLVAAIGHVTSTPGQLHRVELGITDGRHRPRVVDCTVTNLVTSADVQGFVINCRDVTERSNLESQLRHQAFHDPLTGLANRALFADRMQHGLARNRRTGKQLAVMVIDLDGFKNINDSLGHGAGDRVLSTIAGRLLSSLQSGDTVARLGGDEFAVLVEDLDGVGAATSVAQRLSRVLRQPVTLDGQDYRITASIGLAVAGTTVTEVDDLLRDADTAMYEAKNAGKDAVRLFEQSMHEHARERFRLQGELQGAVLRQEFTLHYQPSFDLTTGLLEGFEALVRWEHPDLGLVPPNRFIPLAEETGLIVPLGRWVLQQATRQLATWNRGRTGRKLTMSINVSARQMQDHRLVDDVRNILADASVDPSWVVLEITESMLLHDADAVIAMLDELKAIGVRIAIDDFGTGYASLSYLRRLPLDILKVDKSFLTDAAEPDLGEGETLLTAILNLGKTLGLRTVAEGIEEPEQMAPLHRGGCDSAQGYLFARPLPADQASALIASDPTAPVADAAAVARTA